MRVRLFVLHQLAVGNADHLQGGENTTHTRLNVTTEARNKGEERCGDRSQLLTWLMTTKKLPTTHAQFKHRGRGGASALVQSSQSTLPSLAPTAATLTPPNDAEWLTRATNTTFESGASSSSAARLSSALSRDQRLSGPSSGSSINRRGPSQSASQVGGFHVCVFVCRVAESSNNKKKVRLSKD